MPIDPAIRVLVADDMPAMRSIVRGMLEEIGFSRIVEAEDGELAWELIQQAGDDPAQRFGLVVADWNMPEMSGVDLLRALRSSSLTLQLPFLMVTARGDQAHIAEATRAGVTDYVVKPFNGERLREKIEEMFRG